MMSTINTVKQALEEIATKPARSASPSTLKEGASAIVEYLTMHENLSNANDYVYVPTVKLRALRDLLNGKSKFASLSNGSTRLRITAEIHKALKKLDADPELLLIVGSDGDTLSDTEVLFFLKEWNNGKGSSARPITNVKKPLG